MDPQNALSAVKPIALPLTVAAAVAAAVFGVYVFLIRDASQLLDSGDARLTGRGETVYAEHCASCHGRNLEGQPDWRTRDKDGFLPAPPHDESGHAWHHPDRVLFDVTKRGLAEAANLDDYKTRMPAFADVLADDDIIAVLSYIKSRWPQDMQRRHDALNREYARTAR